MRTAAWKSIGLGLILAICGGADRGLAQTPLLPARPTSTALQPPPPTPEDPLDSDLKRLSRLRQQLSEQLRSPRPDLPLPAELPVPVPERPPTPPELLNADTAAKLRPLISDFQGSHEETSERVDALRRRIEELQVVARQAAKAHAEAAARAAADPGEADEESSAPEDHNNPDERGKKPQSAEPDPPPATDSDLPQTVTGTVDRLALADSLFGSGEIPLALEIYSDLISQSPNHLEADWIHYQVACCHRRLGNRSEAERHYRIVAGQSNAGLLAENARRWLRQVQERRQIEEVAARLKQTRLSLQERFNGDSASR